MILAIICVIWCLAVWLKLHSLEKEVRANGLLTREELNSFRMSHDREIGIVHSNVVSVDQRLFGFGVQLREMDAKLPKPRQPRKRKPHDALSTDPTVKS